MRKQSGISIQNSCLALGLEGLVWSRICFLDPDVVLTFLLYDQVALFTSKKIASVKYELETHNAIMV